jgi:hypothetical protein
LTRARCLLCALALGTLVPVSVALGDKAIRDPGTNGITVAVVLIFGIALSAAVSVLSLWPSSVLYRPNSIGRVLVLTLFGILVWLVVAFLLMHTGPYRMQITPSVVKRYLMIAAYGSTGAFVFYTALFLCSRRFGY